MKLLSSTLRTLAVACMAASMSPFLQAQAQTDITTPTSWTYRTGVSAAALTAIVNTGYRIVDIEVEDDSPLTLSASFVRNTGPYAKNWWWLVGATSTEIDTFLVQNDARLIDVEPYQTGFGLRFAVVMISNTGADFASDHGWNFGRTASQVFSWVTANPDKRLLDIQPYSVGSDVRYGYVWITNTGVHQTPWWYYLGVSSSIIDSFVDQNDVRLVDLERTSNGGAYSAVMLPGDGASTYHLINLTFTQLDNAVEQLGSRIIDFERYQVPAGLRYFAVMRQNKSDLSIAANEAMRAHLPLSVPSGVSLVRIDESYSPLAGVQEAKAFEPGALMKTAYLFTAIRRVALGWDFLTNLVTVNTSTSGDCPIGTGPVSRTLSETLIRMMEQSSYTDAEAIRARYGTNTILTHAQVAGADNIELNHTLGCLCGSPRNEATLIDFALMHRYAVSGAFGQYEDDFHDRMRNSVDFGYGSYGVNDILTNEMASVNLSALEETAFRDGLEVAYKNGARICSQGQEFHYSAGVYVRLPFRVGCNTVFREYFIGAWVNDGTSWNSVLEGMGAGIATLWTEILRDALGTWESANCVPFVNYCPGVPNSSGLPGVTNAIGSSFISENNLILFGADLPSNVFTFMLVGTANDFVPNPAGSLGNLCVGGQIGRYWDSLQSTDPAGGAAHLLDLQAIPKPSTAPVPVQAGETLRFQWWHRDTVNGQPASNFTNALRVTFI